MHAKVTYKQLTKQLILRWGVTAVRRTGAHEELNTDDIATSLASVWRQYVTSARRIHGKLLALLLDVAEGNRLLEGGHVVVDVALWKQQSITRQRSVNCLTNNWSRNNTERHDAIKQSSVRLRFRRMGTGIKSMNLAGWPGLFAMLITSWKVEKMRMKRNWKLNWNQWSKATIEYRPTLCSS